MDSYFSECKWHLVFSREPCLSSTPPTSASSVMSGAPVTAWWQLHTPLLGKTYSAGAIKIIFSEVLTKNTPLLALTGKLWGVFCGFNLWFIFYVQSLQWCMQYQWLLGLNKITHVVCRQYFQSYFVEWYFLNFTKIPYSWAYYWPYFWHFNSGINVLRPWAPFMFDKTSHGRIS